MRNKVDFFFGSSLKIKKIIIYFGIFNFLLKLISNFV